MSNWWDIDFFGLEEIVNDLGYVDRFFMTNLLREMDYFSGLPEEGAKALTPVDENDLTKSITTSKAYQLNNNTATFDIGTNLNYARRMHEWRGGWGEGTIEKQKSTWRGYVPGAKYLENSAEGSADDFEEMMDDVFERAFNHGR